MVTMATVETAEDLAGLFADFGDVVTHSTGSFVGIVDKDPDVILGGDYVDGVSVTRHAILCAQTDIPVGVGRNWQLSVRGVAYRVCDQQDHSDGISRLILEKVA